MNIVKSVQKIGILCIMCSFAFGGVFMFAPDTANASSLGNSTLLAKSSSSSSSKSSSKPAKKPSSKTSKGGTSLAKKYGGRKSDNRWAKNSLSGNCKHVNGKCVVFSTHGCGNFYIGGYHFGGSRACSVLHINCGPANGGGGGGGSTYGRVTSGGGSVYVNTTGNSTSTRLTRDCTPGVSCPADDLGGIIEQALVTPAYAAQNSKTCPLFWVTGRESADSKIKCTLDTGADRALVDVPNDPLNNGYKDGYPLPIGKYTLVCTRTTGYDDNEIGEDENGNEVVMATTRKTDVEKQERVLECKQNPAFREF